MMKLLTVDNEHVWVNPTEIALIAPAKTKQDGGPPLPVLGVCIVSIKGLAMPLVIKQSPEELARAIIYGNASILSPA